jgi:hypothetical protein
MTRDAAAEDVVMGDLVVKRWPRYGHDRLYVQTGDGTRLGHWDNTTSTAVLADGADRAAFDAALAAHRGDVAPARAVVPAELPAVMKADPPVEPEWSDLAAVKAGAAA